MSPTETESRPLLSRDNTVVSFAESEAELNEQQCSDDGVKLNDDVIDPTHFSTFDFTDSTTRLLSSNTLTSPLHASKSHTSTSSLSFLSSLFHSLYNHRLLRHRFIQTIGQWTVVLLIGCLIGCCASFIDIVVHWLIDLRLGYCSVSVWTSRTNCDVAAWQIWSDSLVVQYVSYVIISVLFAICAAFTVQSFQARWSSGSGISEIKTILNGVRNDAVLSMKTLLVKCVGIVWSVSSGLSVGKEGPAIHIAACIGHQCSRLFPQLHHNSTLHSELLSASCAAGVAAAFGAPIGGIIYSLEELSSFFPQRTMLRSFVCSAAATLTLQAVNPYQNGKLVQFLVTYTAPYSWIELIVFALLGCCGGVVGALFIKSNMWLAQFRRHSIIHSYPLLECATVALLSSLLKFPSPLTRGNFTEVLEVLFSDCSSESSVQLCRMEQTTETVLMLLYVAALTWTLSVYSILLSIPAGLLIPSLVAGSAFGRAVGTAVRYAQVNYTSVGEWFDKCSVDTLNICVTPGIYALVGGAALLGGVTRLTITLAIIMFEITGGLNYLLPVMIALLFSKMCGDALGHESIYERAIQQQHLPFLDYKTVVPEHLTVRSAMTAVDLLLCLCTAQIYTVNQLQQHLKLLQQLHITGSPVIHNAIDRAVVGYVTRAELQAALSRAKIRRVRLEEDDEVEESSSFHHPTVLSHSGSIPCFFTSPTLEQLQHLTSYINLSSCLSSQHHSEPLQVNASMSLQRLHDLFVKLGLRYVLVLKEGKLQGIVTKKDILNTLKQHSIE